MAVVLRRPRASAPFAFLLLALRIFRASGLPPCSPSPLFLFFYDLPGEVTEVFFSHFSLSPFRILKDAKSRGSLPCLAWPPRPLGSLLVGVELSAAFIAASPPSCASSVLFFSGFTCLSLVMLLCGLISDPLARLWLSMSMLQSFCCAFFLM